jgi:hypothetical protein
MFASARPASIKEIDSRDTLSMVSENAMSA